MAKRKGIKAKVLFADSNSVFSMKEREVKEGRLKWDKDADFDIDKIPQQTIQYPDKSTQIIFLLMGLVGAVVCMLFIGMEFAIVGFLIPVIVQRIAFNRSILFPLYLLRWNSATPYDFKSASPVKKFILKIKGEKKGEMEIIEGKLEESPKGMKVYKPQTLKQISYDSTLDSLLRFNLKMDKDWFMLIIMLVLGLILGLYLQPQIAAMMANQAAQAAAAAPPPVQ